MGNRSRRPSDYSSGQPGNRTIGPNDTVMAQKHNPLSDAINSVVLARMKDLGLDGHRRVGSEDNDFYRDNAQLMPGFKVDGLPSGAWAQDRAANHVGQGTSRGNPWDNLRRGLVQNESDRMDANYVATGSAELGFGDVYDAHVEENHRAGGGGNQFIDPGSFALAMYGAPLLESLGIDAGPLTGLSIDVLNDPEDGAFEGWVKRMGLGAAEVGAGALMMGTMNPIGMGVGMATAGLGIGSMLWNTTTALATGLGESGVAEWMGDAATGGLNTVGHLVDNLGDGLGLAVDGIENGISDAYGAGINLFADGMSAGSDVMGGLVDGVASMGGAVTDLVGDGVEAAGDFVGDLFSW